MVRRGYPVEVAAFASEMFGWVDRGDEAHLSDGVQRVLGREPRDFSDYVASTASSGAWAQGGPRAEPARS